MANTHEHQEIQKKAPSELVEQRDRPSFDPVALLKEGVKEIGMMLESGADSAMKFLGNMHIVSGGNDSEVIDQRTDRTSIGHVKVGDDTISFVRTNPDAPPLPELTPEQIREIVSKSKPMVLSIP